MNRRQFLSTLFGVVAAAFRFKRLPVPVAYPAMRIRHVRSYDPIGDRVVTRLDVLYGMQIVSPELACRIAS